MADPTPAEVLAHSTEKFDGEWLCITCDGKLGYGLKPNHELQGTNVGHAPYCPVVALATSIAAHAKDTERLHIETGARKALELDLVASQGRTAEARQAHEADKHRLEALLYELPAEVAISIAEKVEAAREGTPMARVPAHALRRYAAIAAGHEGQEGT